MLDDLRNSAKNPFLDEGEQLRGRNAATAVKKFFGDDCTANVLWFLFLLFLMIVILGVFLLILFSKNLSLATKNRQKSAGLIF